MARIGRVNDGSRPTLSSPSGIGASMPLPDLSELPDVDAEYVSDGDVLVWDDASGTWIPGTVSGALTDHTHATTGSGATGGGGTLNPTTLTFPVATSPAQTAEGSAVWDSDDDRLTVGDGTGRKTFYPNVLTTQDDIIVAAASGVPDRLGKGSDGQVLTVDPTTHHLVWATPSSGSVATDPIWDAKGDLAGGTGSNTAARLPVGADDTILMADAAQTTGLKWVASQTPSTQAFGDSATQGTADTYARGDHKHGMPSGSSSGGSLIFLETHTASSSTTVDFTTRNASGQSGATIQSDFDEYEFHFLDCIPASNNVRMDARVSTNGGSTWDNTSTIYDAASLYAYITSTGMAGSSGAAKAQLQLIDSISNNTNYGLSGRLRIWIGSSKYTTFEGNFNMQHATVGVFSFRFVGLYKSTTAINAIQFFQSSGAIASGIIRAYGIAH
jgi:hypothetical protein